MTTSTTITVNENNLINVKVARLVNAHDCQYGVCYNIYHTGHGISAQVAAMVEAEELGLVPSQEDRDRSNIDVWSQVCLAFHENAVIENKCTSVTSTGATAFRPSSHVTINLPISANLAESISDIAKDELRARLVEFQLHKAWDIEAIMRQLGVMTAGGMDHLIRGNGDGRWLTVAGELLVKHHRCYDNSDHGVERIAAVEKAAGEVLEDFGGSHLQWVGVAPAARRLPDQVAEYLHAFVYRHYDAWAMEVLREQKNSQVTWGNEKNKELKDLGLSKSEIKGWWNLSWRREWSTERWAEFCHKYSDIQLAAGLAANKSGNRTDYFEAIGIRLEGSIPRTQDAVDTLALARGLKPSYARGWRRGEVLIDAREASVDASGNRTWSF